MYIYLQLLYFLAVHPFHASVFEIDYIEKKKEMQMTIQMFYDDTEQAIGCLLTDEATCELELEKYLLKNLQMDIDNKSFELQYLGFEEDFDVIYCYLKVENVSNPTSIEIGCQLFFDTFNDQENIVHFNHLGNTQTRRLRTGEGVASFILTDK